jgi:hypothetical protein
MHGPKCKNASDVFFFPSILTPHLSTLCYFGLTFKLADDSSSLNFEHGLLTHALFAVLVGLVGGSFE